VNGNLQEELEDILWNEDEQDAVEQLDACGLQHVNGNLQEELEDILWNEDEQDAVEQSGLGSISVGLLLESICTMYIKAKWWAEGGTEDKSWHDPQSPVGESRKGWMWIKMVLPSTQVIQPVLTLQILLRGTWQTLVLADPHKVTLEVPHDKVQQVQKATGDAVQFEVTEQFVHLQSEFVRKECRSRPMKRQGMRMCDCGTKPPEARKVMTMKVNTEVVSSAYKSVNSSSIEQPFRWAFSYKTEAGDEISTASSPFNLSSTTRGNKRKTTTGLPPQKYTKRAKEALAACTSPLVDSSALGQQHGTRLLMPPAPPLAGASALPAEVELTIAPVPPPSYAAPSTINPHDFVLQTAQAREQGFYEELANVLGRPSDRNAEGRFKELYRQMRFVWQSRHKFENIPAYQVEEELLFLANMCTNPNGAFDSWSTTEAQQSGFRKFQNSTYNELPLQNINAREDAVLARLRRTFAGLYEDSEEENYFWDSENEEIYHY